MKFFVTVSFSVASYIGFNLPSEEDDRACEAFQQLMIQSPVMLPRKTQCTDEVCTGLRWTDEKRLSITLSPAPRTARFVYPVTCAEARYRVDNSGETDPGIATESGINALKKDSASRKGLLDEQCANLQRLTMGQTFSGQRANCEKGICKGIQWRDHSKSRVIAEGPGVALSCYEAAGMNLVYQKFHNTNQLRYEPVKQLTGGISLHYHPSLKDGRVRIPVKFKKQIEYNTYPLSMLLDSGSSQTFARVRTRAQPQTFGYLDNGLAQPVHEVLRFGADFGDSKAVIDKEFREVAWFGDTEIPITLKLMAGCGDKYIDAGILGAGVHSEFAKFIQVYALVPPKKPFQRFKTSESAGTLFLGERDWSFICRDRSKPIYSGVRNDISNTHWIIDGSVKILGFESPDIFWIVDSGAQGLMLTKDVYMTLRDKIHELGGYMPNATPGIYNEIEKCLELYSKFPTIEIRAGTRNPSFVLDLQPLDYLGSFDYTTGMCIMMIDYSEMHRLPNTGILGTKFLERTTTVFDRKNSRVGFCAPTR
jgi:hypothetical protein